jgi:hypothetical protein
MMKQPENGYCGVHDIGLLRSYHHQPCTRYHSPHESNEPSGGGKDSNGRPSLINDCYIHMAPDYYRVTQSALRQPRAGQHSLLDQPQHQYCLLGSSSDGFLDHVNTSPLSRDFESRLQAGTRYEPLLDRRTWAILDNNSPYLIHQRVWNAREASAGDRLCIDLGTSLAPIPPMAIAIELCSDDLHTITSTKIDFTWLSSDPPMSVPSPPSMTSPSPLVAASSSSMLSNNNSNKNNSWSPPSSNVNGGAFQFATPSPITPDRIPTSWDWNAAAQGTGITTSSQWRNDSSSQATSSFSSFIHGSLPLASGTKRSYSLFESPSPSNNDNTSNHSDGSRRNESQKRAMVTKDKKGQEMEYVLECQSLIQRPSWSHAAAAIDAMERWLSHVNIDSNINQWPSTENTSSSSSVSALSSLSLSSWVSQSHTTANQTISSDMRGTPLQSAIMYGHELLAIRLIELKANVTQCNDGLPSPLLLAIDSALFDVAAIILPSYLPALQINNNNGNDEITSHEKELVTTWLHRCLPAAMEDSAALPFIQQLLQFGADIDTPYKFDHSSSSPSASPLVVPFGTDFKWWGPQSALRPSPTDRVSISSRTEATAPDKKNQDPKTDDPKYCSALERVAVAVARFGSARVPRPPSSTIPARTRRKVSWPPDGGTIRPYEVRFDRDNNRIALGTYEVDGAYRSPMTAGLPPYPHQPWTHLCNDHHNNSEWYPTGSMSLYRLLLKYMNPYSMRPMKSVLFDPSLTRTRSFDGHLAVLHMWVHAGGRLNPSETFPSPVPVSSSRRPLIRLTSLSTPPISSPTAWMNNNLVTMVNTRKNESAKGRETPLLLTLLAHGEWSIISRVLEALSPSDRYVIDPLTGKLAILHSYKIHQQSVLPRRWTI